MEKMNRMKLAVLAKEFPILTQLPGYNIEDCMSVVIKRADRPEMEHKPFQHAIISEDMRCDKGDQVFLLDKDSNILGEVKPTRYSIDYTQDGREDFQYGESVLESLFRQGLHRKVQYIVWVKYGIDQLGRVFVLPTWQAYIYKPNTQAPLDEMLVAVYHEAEQEVQRDLEAAGFSKN